MKINVTIFIFMLTGICSAHAQEKFKSSINLGGYYTFLISPVIIEATGDSATLHENYLNINVKYTKNIKWSFSAEYILIFTSPDVVDDPFYITGISVDYNLLRAKKSKIQIRAGLSIGNIVFADDFEPKKQTVVNRIIGVTYDFRISNRIWLYAGYYNHFPLNNIPYKYSIAQPFIGAYINLFDLTNQRS